MPLDVYFLMFVVFGSMVALTMVAAVRSLPLGVLAHAANHGRYTWLGTADLGATPAAGSQPTSQVLDGRNRLAA
jgi:hypothetical protein